MTQLEDEKEAGKNTVENNDRIDESASGETPAPSLDFLAASEETIPSEELEDKPMGAVEPISTENIPAGETGVPDIPMPVPYIMEKNFTDILITEEDIHQLWVRTGAARDAVIQNVTRQTLAEDLFTRIEQARESLKVGKDQFEEADNLVSQVEYQIRSHQRIKSDSRRIAPLLLVYELVMMILVGVGMFSLITPVIETPTILGSVDISQLISSLLWGTLGGIVGALYALWKHVAAKQDFDARYGLWYITNPILGLALGAFIFLAFQAGFFSLTAGSSNNEMIRSAYVIYLFAWIVGFKQNVVYEIVRRILDVFAIKKEDGSSEAANETA